MKTFYNTTNLTSIELAIEISNASKQEHKVMILFKQYGTLTPFEVWNHLQEYPITSIRRAITNLTIKGMLNMTKDQRIGMYGKKNYIWELVN
jgi:N-methylhydantoinase B/oxoprolinase/acetone carboxylase alpha subunit